MSADEYRARFRIAVFGQARGPWRPSIDDAMADAIKLELASWDESQREWYLAVPVELVVSKAREIRRAA
ncbi:hypothetical protein LH128_17377 [Sphingomonas sp. LH128]|uniref:hypothetical protein n=1 Tax=Sphingomonas sp. LH128 TaxID=473781 RepID=UPI00027C9BBE|nr:hypothetical protein [Sphingomonas sp. LH128]EJU11741.1 hypothetical protein LH128_17377 [Sphingomonas sp. LH128]